MKINIYFIAVFNGLLLVFLASCRSDSNRSQLAKDQTARIELTLTGILSGTRGNTKMLPSHAVVVKLEVRNIIVGVFNGEKMLFVQNLTNPNIGGINKITCPLSGDSGYTNCTAVVVANVLSSLVITSLKNAATKTDFIAVQSTLDTVSGRDTASFCFPLFGNVFDANNGNSQTFSLTPGGTTSGLYVKFICATSPVRANGLREVHQALAYQNKN